MKEASDPTSDAAEYLKALGVSVFDANGHLRNTNDVLLDIIPALNALPEGMERNQATTVLFGRNIANVGDLTSLTRQQIQDLMNQAPVFGDDKIQSMDDMATKTALLNEQIQLLSVDLGEDLIPLAEDMIGIFEDMGPAIKDVVGFLHEAATGTTMMVQGLQLLYTQWKYGMDSPEMKTLQKQVQDYAQKEYDERTGAGDQHKFSSDEITSKINKGQTISSLERAWAKKYDSTLYSMIPAAATSHLNIVDTKAADEAEKTRITALVSAYKDYESAIKKVTDAQKDRLELTRDYYHEISNTDDVNVAETLTYNYQKSLRIKNSEVAIDTSAANAAATEFNQIKRRVPLENIKGTDQYTEVQAKKSGDLNLTFIDGTKKTIPGIINLDSKGSLGISKADLIQAGVQIT